MKTTPLFCIPARDRKTGEAILFFPDAPANVSRMVCYVHMGQHSEAHMNYYRDDTYKVAMGMDSQVDALINEYRDKLDEDEFLCLEKCDSKYFQQRRWKL